MSLKSLPCYTVVCDWPDCGADALEGQEFSGWGETEYVIECADDNGWRIGRDGESHYCTEHPCAWASDLADGDAEPMRPYLLIHDGDTDNIGDDGQVSLIRAETERVLSEGVQP